MGFLVCFVLTAVLVAKLCEGKPAPYNGYPEENRNLHGPLSSALLEGDILVAPKIKKIALVGGDVSMTTTRKRGATRRQTWSNGVIPYQIDSTLDAHRSLIENAMREWENGTCLSFVPKSQTVGTQLYLKIASEYDGCFAVVGSVDISKYPKSVLPLGIPLNLDSGCRTRRVIIHELGHSIGFYHEQSRPDRDLYVKILTDNIQSGRANQFTKHSNYMIDSLGFPYDLKSVMHYGPKMFTKSQDKNTIEPVDPTKTLVVNENISDIDRQQVNKLYKCP